MIIENNIKATKGTVLPTSALSDPHVQKIVKYIHKVTNYSIADIEKQIQEEIDRMNENAKKSHVLFGSMAANAVESALFRMFTPDELADPNDISIKGVKSPNAAPEFSRLEFSALIRRIKAENPTLFPLRNFYNKKPIAAPRIVLVPSNDEDTQKKYGSVTTAAATPNGEFIFNTHFMQQCMNYSHVKGIKPNKKKYKSNGGQFPDEYAMLEFLVLHEFYHYSFADFHYQKVLRDDEGKKAKPKIINWVGDFRTNYDLVKAGHIPIPVGLFTDAVNYDTQYTYAEMYNLVKNELKKIQDQQESGQGEGEGGGGGGAGDPEDELDRAQGDDHSHHDDDSAEGEDGEPTDSQGNPIDQDDLEETNKRTRSKIDKQQDSSDAPDTEPGKTVSPTGGRGKGSGDGGTPGAVNWQKVKPRYNWKQLLEKLVKGATSTEVTYQKVHRRNIASIHQVADIGAGVIRPGEKEVESNLVKLCVVIDSSGSMTTAIAEVLANVRKLLMANSNMVAKSFVLTIFATSFKSYLCTFDGKSGTGVPITSVKDVKTRSSAKPISVDVLLSTHESGATNFTSALVEQLSGFAAQKYNILILTDTDIVASGNKEDFLKLYSAHHSQVHLILDSESSWQAVVKSLGISPANISHM